MAATVHRRAAAALAMAAIAAGIGTAASAAAPDPGAGTAPHTDAGSRQPLAGKVVVVNPGHNGRNWAAPSVINALVPAGRGAVKACDTAGTATDAGYSEAAFNWDVSLRLRALLVAQGARVVFTRSSNTGVGPCVNVRAAIGNRAHADAVLSIHADGGPAGGRGYQVIYAPDAGDTAPIYAASLRFARAIGAALLASGVLPPSTYVGQNGYSVRTDLAGLNLSTRPAIFVELGNMRNAVDAGIQTSAAGRQRIAAALDGGLVRYLTGAG